MLGQKDGQADMIRYDTRCYFNVRSKADMSQLNVPHGRTDKLHRFVNPATDTMRTVPIVQVYCNAAGISLNVAIN